jgi:pyruvate kinase
MKELWYTDGPSASGKERELFLSGATGVRLTFSYGTAEYQEERAAAIKKAAFQVDHPCCVVADLAGEKFRLGTFSKQPSIQVSEGTKIRLTHAETTASAAEFVFPVRHASFFSQIKEGSMVTVGDGSAVFRVTQVSTTEALGEITVAGVVNQSRGLSIQGGDFQPRTLTAKDVRDLEHIIASPVYDVIALSFVSTATDLVRVRELAQKANRNITILAKIETPAGLENIASICESADMVMAARGDLALTLPWVELPAAVQTIAAAAKTISTPWILATQIMEGLERFAIPTRAEICDLAHWLSEGCAGAMLSYETAFGTHPATAVACVSTMLKRWG